MVLSFLVNVRTLPTARRIVCISRTITGYRAKSDPEWLVADSDLRLYNVMVLGITTAFIGVRGSPASHFTALNTRRGLFMDPYRPEKSRTNLAFKHRDK